MIRAHPAAAYCPRLVTLCEIPGAVEACRAAVFPREPAALVCAAVDQIAVGHKCPVGVLVLTGLTDADKQMRTTLKYVAVSTDAAKNCLNCKFYQADQHGDACGGCQLFKGPVAPKGNCSSWFAKDQG